MPVDARSAQESNIEDIEYPTVDREVSAEIRPDSRRWDLALNRLIEFSELPAAPDEDGNLHPSRKAIYGTWKLLELLRDKGLPDTIVLDGEGGIVMELFRGLSAERFEINLDGCCEWLHFDNCRLVSRLAMRLPR